MVSRRDNREAEVAEGINFIISQRSLQLSVLSVKGFIKLTHYRKLSSLQLNFYEWLEMQFSNFLFFQFSCSLFTINVHFLSRELLFLFLLFIPYGFLLEAAVIKSLLQGKFALQLFRNIQRCLFFVLILFHWQKPNGGRIPLKIGTSYTNTLILLIRMPPVIQYLGGFLDFKS